MLKNSPGVLEGIPFVLFFFFFCLLTFYFSFVFQSRAFSFLSILFFILTLFTLYFFRDPERTCELSAGEKFNRHIVAPADGTVLDVIEVYEPKYLQCVSTRISIFMSVFSVHVNRSPVEGKIGYLHYHPGKFISAFKEKASLDNEQISIGVVQTHEDGSEKRLLFTLIAGLIARRIILWKKNADSLRSGERIGMIRFGSRVDLYLPGGSRVIVKKGEKVFAGKTVIGYW
ncbi:MAG: phosphatidylserine decarboxylase family protein [Proteobacteria bacterium]|nr:phosphatidylserine decarboxylase family protein [Pseudomonadota bacterium]